MLDVCAAPGGKSFAAAIQMGDRGTVLACDIHQNKLKRIHDGAARLGLQSIETTAVDGRIFRAEWEGQFDLVLVDAPCSGLGVLNRRTEARWTKEERSLSQFPPLQKKILDNGARYVKVGGRLLYSTCTLEQDENTRVRRWFLDTHPEFAAVSFTHPKTGELIEELQILPQRDGINGFYLALFERKRAN